MAKTNKNKKQVAKKPGVVAKPEEIKQVEEKKAETDAETVKNSEKSSVEPVTNSAETSAETAVNNAKHDTENKTMANTKEQNCKDVVLKRETKETNITLGLRIFGSGKSDINTGIGFFDHMLEGFAKHGNFDLKIMEKGDLNVDCHHTVEDLGIVLGQAIAKATEDKTGINRYATFIQPMDDALVLVSVDLCSRAYLNFNYDFKTERVGYFETETLKEFFRAVADNAGMNIHIKVLDGENTHHIIEATFKAFGNALKIACSKSGREGILSTKGAL